MPVSFIIENTITDFLFEGTSHQLYHLFLFAYTPPFYTTFAICQSRHFSQTAKFSRTLKYLKAGR